MIYGTFIKPGCQNNHGEKVESGCLAKNRKTFLLDGKLYLKFANESVKGYR